MGWLVTFFQPQTEFKVVERIRGAGYEVFFPLVRRAVVYHGRRVYRTDPMFPRYAMVKMCDAFAELFCVRGLSGIIMTADGTPAIVPDEEVREIRSRCTGDDVLVVPRSHRFLPGQRVRPKSGALADIVGKFEASSHGRDLAEFYLMGRSVQVSFKQGELVAA